MPKTWKRVPVLLLGEHELPKLLGKLEIGPGECLFIPLSIPLGEHRNGLEPVPWAHVLLYTDKEVPEKLFPGSVEPVQLR